MSAFIDRVATLLSPRAPPLNTNEDTSAVGLSNVGAGGSMNFQDANGDDDLSQDGEQQRPVRRVLLRGRT